MTATAEEPWTTGSRVWAVLYPTPKFPIIPGLAQQPKPDNEWTKQRMRDDCMTFWQYKRPSEGRRTRERGRERAERSNAFRPAAAAADLLVPVLCLCDAERSVGSSRVAAALHLSAGPGGIDS
jgi:hypothetical protein